MRVLIGCESSGTVREAFRALGHEAESKRTGLWLHGLDLLTPADVLELPATGVWQNQTPSGQNKLGPSPDRWKIRSKTYQGIASAMAAQWG